MRYIYLVLILGLSCSLWSQSAPDRHTTTASDGWISCDPAANPNSVHGVSHWIRYDLGEVKSLFDLTFWNMNHPNYITSGIRHMIVEYSTNGSNWTLVDTITVPKAPGSGYYEGVNGPDLEGVNARYLLLTAVDNYGGGCYGLSEVRIYTQDKTEDEFNLAFSPCESEGVYQNLTGGMELGGTYSGMGVTDNGDESFDFDVQKAGAGIHTIVYDYPGGTMEADVEVLPCTDPFCMDCIECQTDDNIMVSMNPIPSDIYLGYQINSDGMVPGANTVEFDGYNAITLMPGFEVQSSGVFIAEFRTCAENRITNSGFESGNSDWTLDVITGNTANLAIDNSNPYEESYAARVTVSNATGTSWHIQLRQNDHTMVAGREYEISFYARSATEGVMNFLVHLNQSPWTSYLYQELTLSPYWTKYTYTFTAPVTVNNNLRITAQYGRDENTYWIDKIRFLELD